jgi:exopolyphosphatase/guanosine-5'-triphosphate,3'-diphosphate pyrophosphatase
LRVAILDLGTNTFHLLIADVKEKDFVVIYKSKKSVKLGQGSIHKNRIAEKSFGRGIVALVNYREALDNHRPDKVFAFATSAIRSSENGEAFVKAAKEQAGFDIEVITGDKEAEFIYFGVKQCIDMRGKPSLIIDIGGGSTEFIIANDLNIFWKHSFNIGAARLLEKFNPSNPVTQEEIVSIEKYLNEQLYPLELALNKFPVERLIGSSGSFDTFAEMIGQRYYQKNILRNRNSYQFDLSQFHELNSMIIHSTKAERVKMKGLVRMRIDMIVIAGICVDYILRKYIMHEMLMSKFALKEGALVEVINKLGVEVEKNHRS